MRPQLEQLYRDVLGMVGAGLLSFGCWLHYPPLGAIAGGSSLLLLAVLGTLRRRP